MMKMKYAVLNIDTECGGEGYKKVWEYVLGKVNKIDKGWVLVKSGSNRGDGSVYGMSKEYRNLGLNKK